MSQPKKPTPQLVEQYVEKFQSNNSYSSADKALTKLFAAYPLNQNLDDVLLKVSALNALYSTNIYAIYPVAEHICELQIDSKLDENSAQIVNKIAEINISGKRRYNYSFATKYCSWHKPDIYPIYDTFVERLIVLYARQDHFASFTLTELRDYTRYKEIIECLRTNYGLSKFSFKELDKFLWLHGQEITTGKRIQNGK